MKKNILLKEGNGLITTIVIASSICIVSAILKNSPPEATGASQTAAPVSSPVEPSIILEGPEPRFFTATAKRKGTHDDEMQLYSLCSSTQEYAIIPSQPPPLNCGLHPSSVLPLMLTTPP